MSHFFMEITEQILMRYQVKGMSAQPLSMLFGQLYDQTNKMGRTHPILLFCKTVLPSVGRKMRLAALKATIHFASKVLCFAGALREL